MLQLTDVARPVVGFQQLHGLRTDAVVLLAQLPVVAVQKVLRQQLNVLRTAAQRRHPDVDGVEPVEQIRQHLLVLHQLLRRPVHGRHDADIHLFRLGCAQRHDGFGVQHPQQLRLQLQRHGVDLVQIDGAAAALLDQPHPILRAGERAPAGAEQQAFQNGLRQRGAVDGHERLILAVAGVVNGGHHQLLAGARFTVDQHRGAAVGNALDEAAHLLYLRRLPHDVLQRVASAGGGGRGAFLTGTLDSPSGAPHVGHVTGQLHGADKLSPADDGDGQVVGHGLLAQVVPGDLLLAVDDAVGFQRGQQRTGLKVLAGEYLQQILAQCPLVVGGVLLVGVAGVEPLFGDDGAAVVDDGHGVHKVEIFI